MKHIDYEYLWVLSIIVWILWFIFIGLSTWKWYFMPLGLCCTALAVAQLYVILFTKDK